MQGLEFSFAFQPIVDAAERRIISFEALVRGPHGQPAAEVFARVPPQGLYGFDQGCRVGAIRLAARLNLGTLLNLNFLPNSVQGSRDYLEATLRASQDVGISTERLVFEVTETGYLQHRGSVERVFGRNAVLGFMTAIDDFKTGFAGLQGLANYQPNYVKLDRSLIGDVHRHSVRQMIVRGIRNICCHLSITPVAEGVETAAEYQWLREAGFRVFQGYYIAPPAFEALPEIRCELL